MNKKILAAIMVVVFFICGLLLFVTRFYSSHLIAQDGYFVSGSAIDKDLLSESIKIKTKQIKLVKMHSNDVTYTNLGRIYVGGDDQKKEVNIKYPIFINNGLGIVNTNDKNTLINSRFEKFETYENFTLTDGKVYNYAEFERSDYEDYYFLMLENGSFVNVQKILFVLTNMKHEVPLNSIVNFQDDYIKYYYYDKSGRLLFNSLRNIALSDTVYIGEKKYTYEKLLIGLGLRNAPEEVEEPEEEEEEPYIIENTEYDGKTVNTSKERPYTKPKVSVEDFTVNVYSASSKLMISDPSGVISGAINFQFYIGEKLYSRKAFVASGKITVLGLSPNTDYHIVGSYRFYDENKKKMEVTFFEQDVHTGDFKDLDPIELAFENGPVYPDKIELDRLRIVSDLENEALKGLNKGTITINGDSFGISSNIIQQIVAGKETVYTSPASLKSNRTQEYVITLLDAFGNELNIKNNTGSTRTSKKPPSSSFKMIKGEVNYIQYEIDLSNIDDVTITNYRYILYKSDDVIVLEEDLDSSTAVQEFLKDQLDPNCVYNVRILGDYDILDGNGTIKDAVLGEGRFTTLPLSSLGYLRVTTLVTDLTNHSATVHASIDIENVSSILLQLLTEFSITIKDPEENIIYSYTVTRDNISSLIGGEEIVFSIDGLSSVTKYDIIYSSRVTQGSVSENISVISSIKNFTTLKRDAYVEIRNQFVNNTMIDFDVRVVDEDFAIESEYVVLEVRDPNSKLVSIETLQINGDFVQLSYTKLDANVNYTLKYYAEEYNIGFDNSTYENDHVLRFDTINTEDGISGSIELQEMLRQITGDNLFNIEDYDRLRKEGNTGYKRYDLANNSVLFGGKNGYVNFSYYLPEIYGKTVIVRFLAKYDDKSPFTSDVYLSKSYGNTKSYKLEGLSREEYKEFEFTFELTASNYIGFLIDAPSSRNERTDVWFKDIRIISTTDSNLPVSLSYHPSGYRFTNTIMKSGREYFTSFDENNSYLLGNPYEGHARITEIQSNTSYDFNYTGEPQEFLVPTTGNYRIELWGAAGGKDLYSNKPSARRGGYGAYVGGDIYLNAQTPLYFYVGGKGADGAYKTVSAGGWNGGGKGEWDHSDDETYGGGGGSTDVRISPGEWNNEDSLKSRIMVAAGGGGSCDGSDGGDAGALSSFTVFSSKAATQTTGHAFGYGQDGFLHHSNYPTAGAGGGFYGGYSTYNGNYYNPGSGGSSYISGYAGCVAYDKKNLVPTITYNDEYMEMDEYLALFKIDLYDSKNEITTDDYFIRIYLDGEEINGSPFRYDMMNHRVIGEIQSYSLRKNKKYTISLAVRIRDRFYEIDSIEINTNSEIRSIRTVDELFAIHPNGKYVVVNDLDISSINKNIPNFYGELDFQGHKLIANWQGRTFLIDYTRGGSVLKNIVLNLRMDNTSAKTWTSPLVRYHYGTIDNIQVNILECTPVTNYASGIITYANYGVIKNFVIHNLVEVHANARFGLVVYSNQGLVKDGYIYGEDINSYHDAPSTVNKDVGAIAAESTTNSRIQRVFSLIRVNRESVISTEVAAGNLIGYANVGKLENSFSVEPDGTNTNLVTQDPNFGRRSTMSALKVYYFSKRTYNTTISSKLSFLTLYDKSFLNNLLNKEKRFKVDTFVTLGYYPQLVMNDCMPNLEWIPLPSVTDTDLIDVTSVEEESNDGDSATVILHLNNPASEEILSVGVQDIQSVEVLSQENENGKSVVRVKLSDPLSFRSQYFLRKIVSKSANGTSYDTNFGPSERPLDIVMYYPVATLNDWKRINKYPSENYILTKDLDFNNISENDIYVSNNFTGILNGNGHTIKNITINSKNGVFACFRGFAVLKNIFIENYDKSSGTPSYGGFIYQTYDSVQFDQVHMKDIKIRASSYVGGLVGYARGSIFTNCSVTNYEAFHPAEASDIRIGGLVAFMNTNGYIANCFVQNVKIDVLDSISTYGVGGIIGYLENGSITNVYATGSIKTNSIYTGGIVGYANAIISNCWSDVNIYSELDYVGGIIGKRDHQNMSSTLVLGPTYSTYSSQYTNINRTSGNPLLVPQKNFFWDNQPFYGYITSESSHEKPLTSDQLRNIETYYDLLDFENNFDYTDVEDGVLPKLLSTSGDLLPNQIDHKFETQQFNVLGTIQVSQRVEDADIYFLIDNPDNLEITAVTFDYLRIETSNMQVTNTGEGYTIVNIREARPIRYYDAYTLTGVSYKPYYGATVRSMEKFVKVDLQFFKNISSYTDWRSISSNTTENYRLTADIDFGGVTNIVSNVSIGRLEGQGAGHTIRNITVSNISTSYALIRKITTSLKNVTFENINLSTKENVTISYYCNIIRLNFADVDNVEFRNITINAPNVKEYVAPIGLNRAQSLRNIHIEGNNITGQTRVGGLIGGSQNYDAYNISAESITVYGSNDYVGGIVGYRDYANPTRWFYFSGNNMNVTGKVSTGGLFGYGGADYSTITNSTITGLAGGTRLGGIAGYNHDRYAHYYDADNITIEANTTHVGGLFGRGYDVNYAYIKNSTIKNDNTGESYTGGIFGYQSGYSDPYNGIKDCTITSKGTGGTGGLFGYLGGQGNGNYNFVTRVTINGVSSVGGAIGHGRTSRLDYSTINAKVNGTGSYVGGVYGYLYDTHLSDSNYSNVSHEVILENTEVVGGDYVAFFAGRTPGPLGDSRFYNLYLVGVLRTSGTHFGIVTPLNSANESSSADELPRVYVYNQNTINGISLSATNFLTTYKFLRNTMNNITTITATDLKTESYYKDHGITTTYFTFTDYQSSNLVSNGYYPFIKTTQKQEHVKYPTAVPSYINSAGAAPKSSEGPHELPKLSVYSSGIQTINFELDHEDPSTKMEVYEGDKKVFEEYLNQRTYTFNYDYTKDIRVVFSDGINQKEFTYKASDLCQPATSFKNSYAYLYDGKLKGNIKTTEDLYIHLYDRYALTSNLDIYDLEKGEFVSKNNKISLEDTKQVQSLFHFKLGTSEIDTFGKYSIIKKEEGTVVYEGQLFFRNGSIEIVDAELDNVKTTAIVDSSGNKNFVTVLGNDGSIYNLKSEIKLPEKFNNTDIRYMTHNINNDSNLVVVVYQNGRVVVFDYRTGSQELAEKATENVSIFEYVQSSVSPKKSIIKEDSLYSYSESIELAKMLEDKPITDDGKGNYVFGESGTDKKSGKTKLSSNYTTYYNVVKNSYDVIDVEDLVLGDAEEVITENDKIYSSNDLVSFYMKESKLEHTDDHINIIVLLGIILFSVIITLGLWFKNAKDLQVKER